MNGIFEKLYDMTAFSNIVAEPQFLVMYVIAFVLLYLGIKKQYEPLLLVPIAFGVLLANFPGGGMAFSGCGTMCSALDTITTSKDLSA